VQRTLPLTPDDLQEATLALEAVEAADQALRNLGDRCRSKDDDFRSGRIRVAISRLGGARQIVEACFR